MCSGLDYSQYIRLGSLGFLSAPPSIPFVQKEQKQIPCENDRKKSKCGYRRPAQSAGYLEEKWGARIS